MSVVLRHECSEDLLPDGASRAPGALLDEIVGAQFTEDMRERGVVCAHLWPRCGRDAATSVRVSGGWKNPVVMKMEKQIKTKMQKESAISSGNTRHTFWDWPACVRGDWDEVPRLAGGCPGGGL